MKIENRIAKFVVVLLIIAVGILGTQIATKINVYNPRLPRGILGLIVIYATYKYGLVPIATEPIGSLFIFPRDFKYFIYMFFLSAVCYWAFLQILYMIVGKN